MTSNPDIAIGPHPLEIGVHNTGDYAVEWSVYYLYQGRQEYHEDPPAVSGGELDVVKRNGDFFGNAITACGGAG